MRVLATLFVAQRCYSTFLRAGQSLDDSHMRPRPSHPPFADGLAHGLGGFGADCWQEANEILPCRLPWLSVEKSIDYAASQ